MQLEPFAIDSHVTEALRLFQVSTLHAANTGTLAGAEGFTSDEDHEILGRIEKQLRRRFAIGTQVSELNIVQDFLRQVSGTYYGMSILRDEQLNLIRHRQRV